MTRQWYTYDWVAFFHGQSGLRRQTIRIKRVLFISYTNIIPASESSQGFTPLSTQQDQISPTMPYAK